MEKLETTLSSNEPQYGVYYRLLLNCDELITVICMQDFDECDYDRNRYVKNKDGVAYYFMDEKDAVKQLNIWYKQSEIDPEYYINQHLIR
jgi:hypothetical protein